MKYYQSTALNRAWISQKSTFIQFFKFCIVGAIGTGVNLAILYSLVEWFHIWYMTAAVVAFIGATTSNYILNKIWTFRYKLLETHATIYSYLKFISVSIIGLVINLAILYVLVNNFHIWYIYAQVIAILVAVMWNYTGSKKWAFSD